MGGMSSSLEIAASRLAALLTGAAGADALSDPGTGDLEFEAEIAIQPLPRTAAPADVWAVDGGQSLVADARCLQLLVTRASRVRFRDGACVLEEEGELRAHLLGPGERLTVLASLALDGLNPQAAVDVNLLRDRWEWDAVQRSVEEAEAGGVVLVDGDLQPDWRIKSTFIA